MNDMDEMNDLKRYAALALGITLVLVVSFSVPVMLALLWGTLIRALGTPQGSPSIPRLLTAGGAAILIVGGVIGAVVVLLWLNGRERRERST